MKKAIVLTYPNLTKTESKLLKETKVFKIACNWHAEELKPDKRLICDRGILDKVKKTGNQPIITCLEYQEGLEDYRHLPVRHSTLLSCIDYLIENDFTDVLLIADNTVTNYEEINTKFQNHNRDIINQQSRFINIYKYSEKGVFDIPHIKVGEFLKMKKQTAEEKILGIKPEEKKKEFKQEFMFTEAYLFEVHTKGMNNKSVENGLLIAGLLPPTKLQEFLEGTKEVEYNGLIIKRITG